MSFIFMLLILLFLIYNIHSNLYKPFKLPLSKYKFNDQIDNYAIHKLTIYKSLSNDYMLILEPQNIHLFIENYKRIIYHPIRKIENVHYTCPDSYELSYFIHGIPRITCHRPLLYLKKFIFTEKLYVKTYQDIQDPLNILNEFFTTIEKIEGIKKLI